MLDLAKEKLDKYDASPEDHPQVYILPLGSLTIKLLHWQLLRESIIEKENTISSILSSASYRQPLFAFLKIRITFYSQLI